MLLKFGKKKFNPRQISNLQLWFDATKINATNGNTISSWSDLSGNGYDATQPISSFQPTYNTNRQNGLPCVTFSNNYMSMLSGLGITANIPGATTFIALKHTSVTGNATVFNISVNGSATFIELNRVNMARQTNKAFTATRRTDNSANVNNTSATLLTTSTFFIHNVINNYSGGTIFQYLNNTQDPNPSSNYPASGNTTNSNSGFMFIGADNLSLGTAQATSSSATISGTTLTVGGTITGTFAIGQYIFGTGITIGTQVISGSGTTWTVNISQTVSTAVSISGYNLVTESFTGDIGEILFYNKALSDAERNQVYTYLKSKWGI